MRGLEIKKRIDMNNMLIEKLMTPNQFTLNNTVSNLLLENRELQNRCEHEFEDGYCIYCYKAKED